MSDDEIEIDPELSAYVSELLEWSWSECLGRMVVVVGLILLCRECVS